MTISELKKLPHGTRVVWSGPSGPAGGGGYVDVLPLPTTQLRQIQWDDGQKTDGRDDWALENVSRAPQSEAV